MSTDGMMDVEVPVNGTVVVQDGEVHDVKESRPMFDQCYCTDGRHDRSYWSRALIYSTYRKDVEPHSIGFQKFELTWEVKK